jgi:hypothetical protein
VGPKADLWSREKSLASTGNRTPAHSLALHYTDCAMPAPTFGEYGILNLQVSEICIVARVWRLYKTGIGLTTGFNGSHTVTHNYSVYTLQLAVHYSTC